MAGSDRSKMRDNPWDPLAGNGRWRVWNSRRGKPSWPAVTSRINRPDIWMQAIRSDPQKTLVARGPSTYGSRLKAGTTQALNHRAMPFDAGLQNLIHRPLPPIFRKNLDLGITLKTPRLDG